MRGYAIVSFKEDGEVKHSYYDKNHQQDKSVSNRIEIQQIAWAHDEMMRSNNMLKLETRITVEEN